MKLRVQSHIVYRFTILMLFMLWSRTCSAFEPEDQLNTERTEDFVRISVDHSSLKDYPAVKQFLQEDSEKYPNIEFHTADDSKPMFIILDKDEKELKRIDISKYSQRQIKNLMRTYGFKETEKKDKEL